MISDMKRTTLILDERRLSALKRLATGRGQTLSALVDEFLADGIRRASRAQEARRSSAGLSDGRAGGESGGSRPVVGCDAVGMSCTAWLPSRSSPGFLLGSLQIGFEQGVIARKHVKVKPDLGGAREDQIAWTSRMITASMLATRVVQNQAGRKSSRL